MCLCPLFPSVVVRVAICLTRDTPACLRFDDGITHGTFASIQFNFLRPHEMNIQRGVESSPRLYELITVNEARSAHTKKLQASIRFRNGVDLEALLLRGHFARPVYGIKLLPIWLRCLSLQTGSKSDLRATWRLGDRDIYYNDVARSIFLLSMEKNLACDILKE